MTLIRAQAISEYQFIKTPGYIWSFLLVGHTCAVRVQLNGAGFAQLSVLSLGMILAAIPIPPAFIQGTTKLSFSLRFLKLNLGNLFCMSTL